MKPDYVVLIAAGLFVAFVAFAAGGISVTQANTAIPHGAAEYWLNRYQGLIAGLAAVAGLWFVFLQLRSAGRQHRAIMLFNLEPERRALLEVNFFTIAAMIDTIEPQANEAGVPRLEQYDLGSRFQQSRELIAKHCDPFTLREFDCLEGAMQRYNRALEIMLTSANEVGKIDALAAYEDIEAHSLNLLKATDHRRLQIATLYEV